MQLFFKTWEGGERGITQYKPDGTGGTRVSCRGYERAGGRPVREVLRAIDLLDYEPAVSGFVEHQAALPARYEEVLCGGMTRERCIERTEAFLRNEYHDLDPEVFLVCTLARVRGEGALAANAAIERDVYRLTEIFEEARRRLTTDNG